MSFRELGSEGGVGKGEGGDEDPPPKDKSRKECLWSLRGLWDQPLSQPLQSVWRSRLLVPHTRTKRAGEDVLLT